MDDPDLTHKLIWNPFKKRQKPVEKELLPFQQESVASNQQAVPLPYFAGTNLIAGRFLSKAIDMVSDQVVGSGKKG